LTGSSTNPLPAQSPWSGGSKVALKLVTSMSRLLTPLRSCSRVPVEADVAAPATGGGGWAARTAPLGTRRRAPFDGAVAAGADAWAFG
jgi:hypothetical protein